MRALSIWAGALILVAAMGCSSGSTDDDQTDDALTAAQASTELAELVAHPETSLRGVGDPVLRVEGAEEVWSFYPYHPDTTVKTAASVADDTESAFLVVGSSGAILLVDLATGAGAATVPDGTTAQEVAARLKADLHAATTSTNADDPTTASLHTNGLGRRLIDALETKIASATEKIASKLADGDGLVARAVAATEEKASKVVAYFMGHETTSTAAPATDATASSSATPATPNTTPSTTAKLLKGPAEVALAIEKLAAKAIKAVKARRAAAGSDPNAPLTAEDRAIPVESVTTDPSDAFSVRRPSHADVLKSKTSGEVAVTADDAKKLVERKPDSVWTPGDDPAEVAALWTQRERPAEFVVAEDVEKSSLQKLKDAGHKAIGVVRAETVKAVEEAKAELPFHKNDDIAETRSDGAARSVLSAAKTYLVKGWDESLLKMSDDLFMKTPIFQAIDALASRVAAGDALPEIDLVGDGVPEDLLAATIKRAMELLHKVGVDIAENVIGPAIHGAKPAATPPKTTPPTTPTPSPSPSPSPSTTPSTTPTPPSTLDAGSSAPSTEDNGPVLLPPDPSTTPPHQKADAGSSKHAAKPIESGCAVSARGHSSAPDAGGMFVVGLAAALVRRRRR